VALLYKLLAFEQHIKDKERYFETGLMSRFRIYNRFLSVVSNMPIVPVEDVDAIFKRALPQNDLEISQMINNLTGIVDKETLVSQLSFVRDAKETIELAEHEPTQTATDDELAKNEITDQNATNDNPLEV
jgi:SPP1 family phage portal protein